MQVAHAMFQVMSISTLLLPTRHGLKRMLLLSPVNGHLHFFPSQLICDDPNSLLHKKRYASSTEIQSYLKAVVAHFNLERFIRYNSAVLHAQWNAERAVWIVDVQNHGSVESEILINAGGILNHPQMPQIDGVSSFGGPLLHTACWDRSVDLRGKRVAVIGAGASAIQLIPQIQRYCRKVDVYIRTPSWISPPAVPVLRVAAAAHQQGPQAQLAAEQNHEYRKDEMDHFRRRSDAYLETRKEMDNQLNGKFKTFFKKSPEQRSARAQFEERMKQLIPDRELQRRLIPAFEVGCRRINPGEAYLEALQKDNVEPIFEPIREIVADGLILEQLGNYSTNHSCVHRPADILIAATGFNTTFRPRIPIIGLNGVNLQDQWASDPVSYMGLAVAGYPNYLMFLGPNTPISNGSLMGMYLLPSSPPLVH